jgi:hypothetical protein
MDKYIENKLKALKESKTELEELIILNEIYDDGFSDGVND